MLRPSFPRLSHPGLAQAIPSIALIAQVYRDETRGFAHNRGAEGDRSTATGASTLRPRAGGRDADGGERTRGDVPLAGPRRIDRVEAFGDNRASRAVSSVDG